MNLDELSKFVSPIAVGLISAYFGSLFAIRKFKSEKAWDERRLAYMDVIDSFEELIYWSEQVRASFCCEPGIGGEVKFDESLRKIAKYSATGNLIFSPEFHEILKQSNTLLSRVRFQIDDESKPDLYTESGRETWYSILAREMRKILDEKTPELIDVARREIPENNYMLCRYIKLVKSKYKPVKEYLKAKKTKIWGRENV